MIELTLKHKKFLKYIVIFIIISSAGINYNINLTKSIHLGMISAITFSVLDIYSPN